MATLQDLINQERRGAVVVSKPGVAGASAIINPTAITSMNSGITSAMPSFASGKDNSVGMGEAFQRSAGYDPVWAWMNQYKPVITPTPPVLPTNNTNNTNNAGSTGSTGGTKGMTATEALALAKFNYDKQQDDLKLGGMQSYYDSGTANKGFDDLLKMIGDQGAVSEGAVKGAYDKAITNIDQGYTAAQNLGDSGYKALNAYLGANQNNPYAGMQATVGSAADALTQYLSAYGVSDKPVQGQIQADQLQAQQGAGNFNNLTNLLSSIAQSCASSRGAESAMGHNLFDTTLGQERAGYKTKAEMAQADAMRQIQEIMYQQRLANESSRNAQMQQLAAALAAAGGNPVGGGGAAPVTTQPPVEVETQTPVEVETQTPFVPLPGHLLETASPEELVANQLANLLAPAQAQGTTAQQLLDELNARRGR